MTEKGQICLLEHERFKSGVEMEGSEASDWKEGITWKNVFGTIGQIFYNGDYLCLGIELPSRRLNVLFGGGPETKHFSIL